MLRETQDRQLVIARILETALVILRIWTFALPVRILIRGQSAKAIPEVRNVLDPFDIDRHGFRVDKIAGARVLDLVKDVGIKSRDGK